MQDILIPEVDRASDATALQALDTSFASQFVYRVESANDGLRLRLAAAASPVQKRLAIDLNQPAWNRGYVAVREGKLCGFIASRFETWNRRLAIWHFYVDRSHRRQGIGRALMDRAIAAGAEEGALTAWVEASNCNHAAVAAYQRLGFSLCGFDLTLYHGTPSEAEFALFLARPIAAGTKRGRNYDGESSSDGRRGEA